jgi:hypothetical protein
MPGQLTDPLEHLWIMRWSKTCLTEGRSPFFCPSLNYPTGVPLGYFPTLHVQTLAYLALSPVLDNDVACFNVLWFSGFVATGLSTFLLAWWTVRKLGAAWLAGLGAMLCGPMLMHAHGHLETMQMGAVPLFLIAWLRFVDGPSIGRLITSAGLYLLVVACAPYFAVLAVFPAAWYVGWATLTSEKGDRRSWILDRAGWLVGFGMIVLPGLTFLFSSQVWAAVHGFAMARPRSQFNQFGAPVWSTFVPSRLHLLGRTVTPDVFALTGNSNRMSECSSYLGIVTLALLAYAAIRRVRFARSCFWWSVLCLMVVLSWGASLQLGSSRISLPAGWFYGIFPPFHLIRVPARFNLFAAICAAVPASAGLADLMSRIKGLSARHLMSVTLAGLTMVDLSMVPFETAIIPPMPRVYRDLTYRNPETTLVDAPMFGSNEGQVFSSLWGYWQSDHQARTTAGYPGLPNAPFEAEIVRASPFWAGRLIDPNYLIDPASERFGAVEGINARDYAWLFLAAHKFDHVVLHQGRWIDPKYAGGSDRIKSLLVEAKVFENADVAVFYRDRLLTPTRLTWLCGEGFRPALARTETSAYGVLRKARVMTLNPTPGRKAILTLTGASAFAHPRVVRLLEGTRELARWRVGVGASQTIESPPFALEGGLRELSLESDGEDQPTRYADRLDEARTPYSWRLNSVRLRLVD